MANAYIFTSLKKHMLIVQVIQRVFKTRVANLSHACHRQLLCVVHEPCVLSNRRHWNGGRGTPGSRHRGRTLLPNSGLGILIHHIKLPWLWGQERGPGSWRWNLSQSNLPASLLATPCSQPFPKSPLQPFPSAPPTTTLPLPTKYTIRCTSGGQGSVAAGKGQGSTCGIPAKKTSCKWFKAKVNVI